MSKLEEIPATKDEFLVVPLDNHQEVPSDFSFNSDQQYFIDKILRKTLKTSAQELFDFIKEKHKQLLDYSDSSSIDTSKEYSGICYLEWEETEEQVVKHLDEHMDKVSPKDIKTKAILKQMRIDEKAHSKAASDAGAAELPIMAKKSMSIIAKIMSDSQDHPDVDELYKRATKIDSRISIATVYRTVKLFEEAGIIAKHDFKGGKARYEELNESHHDHLIDIKSGEIIKFVDEEIEKLQNKVAEKYGYRLVDHKLELYGIKKSES